MQLLDLMDNSYDIFNAILAYLDRQALARLSVTTSIMLDVCRVRMVRIVEFHGTFPLSTYASFCRFMLCSQARLSLLESLFLNLSACNIDMDDLGELDALLGLDEPEDSESELNGPEFLETLLAPLLESSVNLKRLSLGGIQRLEFVPSFRTALSTSFSRVQTLSLTGRSLIELLGHALRLDHATIPLTVLFLQLMPEESWTDIWHLLEPCRNTLVVLTLKLTYRDRHPIPPLESYNPWPRMSELVIISHLLPITEVFTPRILRMAFPNLQHLRIPSGAVSPFDAVPIEPSDEALEDEIDLSEWRTLCSFSGHAITWVSLGFNSQLTELRLDSDHRSINAPKYPNTARHLSAALRLAQPQCFSLEIFDVCTPFDEDLEDELCKPSLWEGALHLEYAQLTITEGPCCNRLFEFLARFCESLQAARVSYLSLHLSTCRTREWIYYGQEYNMQMISAIELQRDVARCFRQGLANGPLSLNYVEITVWDRPVKQVYRYLYRVRRHANGMGDTSGDGRVEFISLDSAVASIVKRSLGVDED